jgi:hypothetical protein
VDTDPEMRKGPSTKKKKGNVLPGKLLKLFPELLGVLLYCREIFAFFFK